MSVTEVIKQAEQAIKVKQGGFLLLALMALMLILISVGNVSSSLANNQNIVFATSIFIIASTYLNNRKARISFPILICGSAVIAWMAASNGLAVYMGIEPARWSRVFDLAVQIIALLTLITALRSRPEVTSWLMVGLLIAFAVNSTVLVYTWLTLENPQSYNWVWGLPNFVNIRFFASFMMVVACVSLWGSLVFSSKVRFLFYLILCLSLAQIFWSGSRSPLFSIVLASLIFGFLAGRTYLKRWLHILVLTVLAGLLAAQFPVDSNQLGVERALGFGAKTIINTDNIDELSSGRLRIWKDAAEWIVQKPILGWGGDYYREVSAASSVAQVHNGPLQIAIEWGIPLALLMYGILLYIFIKCSVYLYANKNTPPIFTLGYFLFTSMLIHSLLDGVFYHGTMLFFMMVPLALLLSTEPMAVTASDHSNLNRSQDTDP